MANELGRVLREGRIAKGLKQREVAQAVGLKTDQPVSNWERGVNIPEPRHMRVLIPLYGLDKERALLLWAIAQMATPADQEAVAPGGLPLDVTVPEPRKAPPRKRRGSGAP